MSADSDLPAPALASTLDPVITYESPYEWPAMREWLAARAIPGVELVEDDAYMRTVAVGGAIGVVRACHLPHRHGFLVSLSGRVPIEAVRARLVRLLDLDRDVAAAVAHLTRDRWLASIVTAHPGLRVPGAWEPFELAVRAVLGQQVTIAAARGLASHLVRLCGVRSDGLTDQRLTHVFPAPADLLRADLAPLAMPGARNATLRALAAAALDDPQLFRTDAPLETSLARLRAIPGIGDWTAHYVALRALRATDAFPASDVGLLRGAAMAMGGRRSPRALRTRAEAWRPHRAYAAQLLWAADAARQGDGKAGKVESREGGSAGMPTAGRHPRVRHSRMTG